MTLVLFDGLCGLCDRLVQFLLRRDRCDVLRFAALQSPYATELLARHARDPGRMDTVFVIEGLDTPEEKLHERSRAVFFALSRLGGAWRAAGWLSYLPAFVTDLGYRFVARVRYRLFGKLDACAVPSTAQRNKFLT